MLSLKGLLRITSFVLIVLAGFSLSSCLPGTRFARKYVHQKEKEAIFLLSPDFLYKENLNTTAIQDYKTLDTLEKDSALYFNSCFIQYIDDSLLIKVFYDAMFDALREAGYKVYQETDMQDFLIQDKAWIVSIAQQELDEYAYPFSQEGVFEDTVVYSEELNVNGLALNTWFEVSRVNDTAPMLVLFNPSILEDRIDGDFLWNPFKEEYPYFYSRLDIQPEDAYVLAAEAGSKNAGLFLDYFMNSYVDNHRKTRLSKDYYLHFDLQKNKVRLAKQERLMKVTP